jgi:hypothetical protein
MRRVALVAAITVFALFAALAGPAEAVPVGAVYYNGKATLNNGFPCTGNCSGTYSAKGTGVGRETVGNKPIQCSGCKVTATYTYQEPSSPCAGNVPLSALGTAKGTITFKSKPPYAPKFSWTRVGITAVITLSNPTGVSVAVFVPPTGCTSKKLKATVAGVAVFG